VGSRITNHSQSVSTNIARNEGLNNEISAAKLPQVKLFASYSRLSDVPNSEVKLPILPNPVVLQEPILNSYNLRLNVTQPVFTGNRISSQEKGIENQTKVLKADYEILKSEETIKIISAYYTLSAAMEQLKLVKENITLMQKRLTDINDFLQNGLATRNDVLKVEVQISNLISKKNRF
jgi:outer membrane protein